MIVYNVIILVILYVFFVACVAKKFKYNRIREIYGKITVMPINKCKSDK